MAVSGLIWSALSRRKVLSLSTVASVSVMSGMLFVLYLLNTGISAGMETAKERMGADILVLPSDPNAAPEEILFAGAPVNVYMPAEIESKIAAIPGVERVTSQFFTQTLNSECCSVVNATRLIGFDPDKDRSLLSWLNGRAPAVFGRNDILMGSKAAHDYRGTDVMILRNKYRIAGVLEATGTGIDYAILIRLSEARRLARESDVLGKLYWNSLGDPDNLVSAVLVKTDGSSPLEDVARAIRFLGDVKAIKTSDVLRTVRRQMDTMLKAVLLVALMMALSCTVLILSRFYSLAWDRKGEWGLYRALGASRRDLKSLVVGEAVTLIMAGIPPGLVLGGFIFRALLAFLRQENAFPFIGPSLVSVFAGGVIVVFLFLVLGLAASVVPAVKSAGIEPSTAMALDDID